MDELSKWNMKTLDEEFLEQNLLQKLPHDLDQFYDYILDRIEPLNERDDSFVSDLLNDG